MGDNLLFNLGFTKQNLPDEGTVDEAWRVADSTFSDELGKDDFEEFLGQLVVMIGVDLNNEVVDAWWAETNVNDIVTKAQFYKKCLGI